MKKRKSLLVLGSALMLLGFFLPYMSYGSRSASGWDIARLLIGQGFLRNLGELLAAVGLALLAVASITALVLAFLGKRGQSAAATAGIFGVLMFTLQDLSSVFRFPGIGLFITLAGFLVLLYRAVFVRR